MPASYPVNFETGDIVFTCIGTSLFREISSASRCWSNHVGIIIGHNGRDYIVAESRVPLSCTTTLNRFIDRSVDRRYSVCRLRGNLSDDQKSAIVEQVPSRLGKWYHTGFNYNSSRQFCSKFVFDIYQQALSVSVGKVETFENLLNNNPDAPLKFWRFWFFGAIPWQRETVTPASLWHNPGLYSVFHSHAENGDIRTESADVQPLQQCNADA
ncbi:YebB family permuted papain-like enzyme [Enterobacter cloacae]